MHNPFIAKQTQLISQKCYKLAYANLTRYYAAKAFCTLEQMQLLRRIILCSLKILKRWIAKQHRTHDAKCDLLF